MAEEYSIVYMHHIFFIHSLIVGHLGWFYSLAIVNSTSMNMGVQVSLLYVDLYSSWHTPKTGKAGPIK
jgi:hypothetical protein